MQKTKKLVIGGDSAFAQIAYEYFSHDSCYEVVGFTVETAYMREKSLFGLPIVAFEQVQEYYDPLEHSIYIAIVYTQLNRLRTRLLALSKQKGFAPASFISPYAFVWKNVEIGEHCFIFENNVLQPFVSVGNNVVLWSGNHIGHHSRIRDNVFVASHAVISGFCDIQDYSFIGVNATISNNVTVGRDCVVGASALVTRNIEEDRVVKSAPGEATGSARRLSRVPTPS